MSNEKNSDADKIVGSTDGLEGKLTTEQVENWRRVLLSLVGPYALIMPVDQVQAMRDKFQDEANNLPSNAMLSGAATEVKPKRDV